MILWAKLQNNREICNFSRHYFLIGTDHNMKPLLFVYYAISTLSRNKSYIRVA